MGPEEEEELEEESVLSVERKLVRSVSLSPSGDALEDDFGDMKDTTDFPHLSEETEHRSSSFSPDTNTEIPYTFDVPESEEDLQATLHERSNEEVQISP